MLGIFLLVLCFFVMGQRYLLAVSYSLIVARCTLPSSLRELLGFGKFSDIAPYHGFAQIAADFG